VCRNHLSFSEEQRTDDPISHYAASKKAIELFARSYFNITGFNITLLRLFTVYGPRGRPDMACLNFIDKISRGEAITVHGDGMVRREFTYISDIVSGIVSAIDRPKGFLIVNLGGGSVHTLNEMITAIEKHLGKKASIKRSEPQVGDVPFTSADQSTARDLLDYYPRVSLDEGIRLTTNWYKGTYLKLPPQVKLESGDSATPCSTDVQRIEAY